MRRYKDDYMNTIMTPPIQEAPGYGQNYRPGEMNIINRNRTQEALGDLPVNIPTAGIWSGESNSWMPIVIIVVSAMALITVYAVVMKR
jgi:hypothetical protein